LVGDIIVVGNRKGGPFLYLVLPGRAKIKFKLDWYQILSTAIIFQLARSLADPSKN